MHLFSSRYTESATAKNCAELNRLREMQEFIAGDAPPVDADPIFREQLRERLWAIVSERQGNPTPHSE